MQALLARASKACIPTLNKIVKPDFLPKTALSTPHPNTSQQGQT
jgi:hypothetical protein